MIKYIWSAELPVGTRFVNPLYGRSRVVVLRSGPGEKVQWRREKINFYEDATKSVAIANYDDFVLLPLEHKPFSEPSPQPRWLLH